MKKKKEAHYNILPVHVKRVFEHYLYCFFFRNEYYNFAADMKNDNSLT